MRVLLVEDSPRLRKSIGTALKASGYAVDLSEDGEEGLFKAQTRDYDVVILDIMLPKLDGRAVLDRLRKEGRQTPVLFLTANDSLEDRVRGLQRGADDYLTKPFALEELLARVGSLCRRNYRQSTPVLTLADLELDTAAKTVRRGSRAVSLTAREFALLEYLMRRRGHVVSRTEIEEHIYDDLVAPMSNVVDSAVYTLRKRIAVYPDAPSLIHTRRGQGYVMSEEGS
ncbi:MAG: response regulator transcription factor [Verrucomicrobia bacterium]|nr:response regulator transcription factor [Verrucomicrobiota bacterium]MBI3870383.1 response regulator transcription factor [Verrucomicrobiota bacterium]